MTVSTAPHKAAGRRCPGDEPTSSAVSPEVTVLDVSDHRSRRVPSKTWRELIKKIREVDPLGCPRCGHEMKIISLIHEPDVIERILRHPGLWKQHPDHHEEKLKRLQRGRLSLMTSTMAGPGIKSPSSSPTDFDPGDRPHRPPQEQYALQAGQTPSFKPSATKKMCPKSMCADLRIIPTSTVSHRGGSCLHFPTNRHQIVLNSIQDSCYPKTIKKRFLITRRFCQERSWFPIAPLPSCHPDG
jgi:hypothetical protein